MASKKRYQADHVADTRGQGWIGLPIAVGDSQAYLALTVFERAVLAEILRRFLGYNNGDIAITYEEIGARLKGRNNKCPPNNTRIAKAIGTLVLHGLLDEPTPQSWVQRRARRYRLTFISSGKAPPFRLATNDYLRWTPTKAKIDGYDTSPRKPQSGDAALPRASIASDAESSNVSENSSFTSPPFSSPGYSGSLVICKPYQGRNPEGAQTHSDARKNIGGPISSLVAGPWTAPTCETCGAAFKPGNRGKPKRFCSERCRKRAETRRRHERAHSAGAA